MPENKAFIDTNLLLYLLSEDPNKADRAKTILRAGATISVQVLNELANKQLCAFYRPIEDGVEIIRVLDGARDIEALFNP